MCFPLWVGLALAAFGLAYDVTQRAFPLFTLSGFVVGLFAAMYAAVVVHEPQRSTGVVRQLAEKVREHGLSKRFWMPGLPMGSGPTLIERQGVGLPSRVGFLAAGTVLVLCLVLVGIFNPSSLSGLLHPDRWSLENKCMVAAMALILICFALQVQIARRTCYRIRPPFLTVQSPFTKGHVALADITRIYTRDQSGGSVAESLIRRVEIVLETRDGFHALLTAGDDDRFLELLREHCPQALFEPPH